MKKGYITVYLSLSLLVILSLILTLIEGARMSATKMKAVCVADIAINSIFSEYNRELFDQYDILMIDMGYGAGDGSVENVAGHLQHYLLKNLDEGKVSLSRDLIGMRYSNACIEEYALATDNTAEAVRHQIADYMKTTIEGNVTGLFDDISGELGEAGFDYDIESAEAISSDVVNSSFSQDGIDNTEEDNPISAVEAVRAGGILGTVLDDTSQISTIKIDPNLYVSNRKIKKGNGLSAEEKEMGSLAGKPSYVEYLFSKCGYYMSKKENSKLEYEIEYIIKNKDNDWDNLEAVCKTMALWREGINFEYLLTDASKYEEAKAMALTISAVILNPELEEAFTMAILLAWAYVESLQDMKILLEGDGVPVCKTAESWHTVLSDIFHPRSALKSYPGQIGTKYGDYLKTMLLMTSFQKIVTKSLDIMEMDVRKASGNMNFKMDACMHSCLVDIQMSSTHKHNTEVRRRSGYYYAYD